MKAAARTGLVPCGGLKANGAPSRGFDDDPLPATAFLDALRLDVAGVAQDDSQHATPWRRKRCHGRPLDGAETGTVAAPPDRVFTEFGDPHA